MEDKADRIWTIRVEFQEAALHKLMSLLAEKTGGEDRDFHIHFVLERRRIDNDLPLFTTRGSTRASQDGARPDWWAVV